MTNLQRPGPDAIPFRSLPTTQCYRSTCRVGAGAALAGALLICLCGCPSFELPMVDEPVNLWPGLNTGWQVKFYTPLEDGPIDVHPTHPIDSWVRMKPGRSPEPPMRIMREGNYTVCELPAGRYTFEYLIPHRQEQLIYGELDITAPTAPDWATDFIRHTFLLVNPTMGMSETGHPSILTDEDLRRVAAGDVVTKFAFIADLRAIEGSNDLIELVLRGILDLEDRSPTKEECWDVKTTNRRRNALYDGDYGEDIPALHLAWWQLFLGPEAYHWRRYSEADDRMRTYQQRISDLRVPAQCLREERSALRAILASAQVLHRRGDLVLATPDMTRRYWDPNREDIPDIRRTWLRSDPQMELVQPYFDSQTAQVIDWWHVLSFLGTYPRTVRTNTRIPVQWRQLGRVVAVMRIGPREPWRLQYRDWPASLTAPGGPSGMGRRVPAELGQ